MPGQYVNILVPGTDQTRSYSFSSGPQADEVSFLLRNTDTGALPTYLRERAKKGDRIEFNGPLGSFYLRPILRPLLFLAGGTGLAPFLSMLDEISRDGGCEYPVHLILGVTNDPDLVKLDELEGYAKALANFTFTCTVADENSSYPNKGFVTGHIGPEHLNGGDADVYLCGPPPMVDAVRSFLTGQSAAPANFYYEKFSSTGLVVESGAEQLKPIESDEAFDARMALELGAVQLTLGRLTDAQLAEFHRLAEATAPAVTGGHFTDAVAYRETNAAFHSFLVEATGNATLIGAHRHLSVLDYMAQALAPGVEVIGDIVQDHRDLVAAYERGDLAAARDIVVSHTDHAKATMRAGIAKSSGS